MGEKMIASIRNSSNIAGMLESKLFLHGLPKSNLLIPFLPMNKKSVYVCGKDAK